MANDRKQKLYDRLTAKGLKFNGIEGFDEKMKDRATAQKIYDRGVAHGLKFNDFDNWYSEFGPQKATSVTETVQPAATVTEPTNTTAAAPAAQPVPTPQPAVTEVAAAPAVEAADQTQQPVVEEPAVAESAPQVEHNADALTDDTPLQSWETPFDRSKFLMNRMSNANARDKMLQVQGDLEEKAYDTYHDPYGLKAQQLAQFNKANEEGVRQAQARVATEGFDASKFASESGLFDEFDKLMEENLKAEYIKQNAGDETLAEQTRNKPRNSVLGWVSMTKEQEANAMDPQKAAQDVMLGVVNSDAFNKMVNSYLGVNESDSTTEEQGEQKPLSPELKKAIDLYSGVLADKIQESLFNHFKETNGPSNWAEFIGSKMLHDNIISKVADMVGAVAGRNPSFAENLLKQSIQDYEDNNAWEVTKLAGNFAPMAMDMWLFGLIGKPAGLIANALGKGFVNTAVALGRGFGGYAAKRHSFDVATRWALNNSAWGWIANNIITPGVSGTLTMGTFNTISGAADAVSNGQSYTFNDVLKAYKSGAMFSLAGFGGRMLGNAIGSTISNSAAKTLIHLGSEVGVEGSYMTWENLEQQAELKGHGAEWYDMDWSKAAVQGFGTAGLFKLQGILERPEEFKKRWNGESPVNEMKWTDEYTNALEERGYNGEVLKFMKTGNLGKWKDSGAGLMGQFDREYEAIMKDGDVPVNIKRALMYTIEGKVTAVGHTLDRNGNEIAVMDPNAAVTAITPGKRGDKFVARGTDPFGLNLFEKEFSTQKEMNDFIQKQRKYTEANNLRYAENFVGALTEEEYEAIMAESNDLTEDEIRDKVSKAQIEKRDRLIAETKKIFGKELEVALNKPYENRSADERNYVRAYLYELEHAGQTPEVRALDEATGEDGMVVFAEKNADGKEVYVVKYPENEKEVAIIDTETGEKEVVLATEITELGSESAEDVLASIKETYDPAKGPKKGNVVWIRDYYGRWQETEIDSVDADGSIWFTDPVSGLKSVIDKNNLDDWQQRHDAEESKAMQDADNAAKQDELRQKQEAIKAQQQKDHDEAPFFVEVDGKMVPAAEYNEVGAGLADVKLMDGTYLQDFVDISKIHPGDDVRASEKKEADAAVEMERKKQEEEAAKKAAEEKKATLKNIEDQLKTSVDENGVADVEAQVKKLVDDGILTPGEAKVFENQIKAKRQEIAPKVDGEKPNLSADALKNLRDSDVFNILDKVVSDNETEYTAEELGNLFYRIEDINVVSDEVDYKSALLEEKLNKVVAKEFDSVLAVAFDPWEQYDGHRKFPKYIDKLNALIDLGHKMTPEQQKQYNQLLEKAGLDTVSGFDVKSTDEDGEEYFIVDGIDNPDVEIVRNNLGGGFMASIKAGSETAKAALKAVADAKDWYDEGVMVFAGSKTAIRNKMRKAYAELEKMRNAKPEKPAEKTKKRGVNPFPNMPQGEKWTPKPDQYGIKEGDVFYDKKGNKITLSRYGDSGVGFGGIYNVFDKDGRVLSNGGVKADEIQKKLKNGTWKKANGDEPSPINKAIETFKSATDKLYKAFQKGPDAPKEVAESDKAEKELAKQMESLSDEDLLKMATATGEAKYDRPLEILVGEELKRRYWNETGFTDKNRATYDRKQLVLGNEAQKMWLYGDHIHGHGKDVADEWLRAYNELSSKPFATEKEWDDHVADVRKTEEKTPRRSKDKPNPKYPKAEGEWLAALDARAGWKNAFDAWEAATAARKEWLEIMKAMPKTDNYDELRNWFNDRYNELKSKYGENDMRALYAKSYLDNPKQTKSFLVKGEPKPEPKKPESNKELAKVEQDRYNEDMEKFKNPKALVPEGEQGWKDWIKATENLVKEREKEGNQEAAASLRGAVRAMKDRFEYMKSHGTWDGKGKWKGGKPKPESKKAEPKKAESKKTGSVSDEDRQKIMTMTREDYHAVKDGTPLNDKIAQVSEEYRNYIKPFAEAYKEAHESGDKARIDKAAADLLSAFEKSPLYLLEGTIEGEKKRIKISNSMEKRRFFKDGAGKWFETDSKGVGTKRFDELTPEEQAEARDRYTLNPMQLDRLKLMEDALKTVKKNLKAAAKAEAPVEEKKQNKTNGLVENEGSRKLEEATRNLLDSMGSQTGRNVEVKKLPEGVDGYYDPKTNTIYVAEDVVKVSDEAVRWTMGHETTHLLKDENPELWPRFESFVKTSMGVDKFNEKVEKLRKKYQEAINDPDITEEMREALRRYTDADYREEVLANWAGDHALVDKKFAEKLIKDAEEIGTDVPGLIKKFIASIERMITNIKKAIMGKPNADEIERLKSLENAKKIWSQMYDVAVAKHNAAVEQANNGETLGKKRMSLRDLERDGNPDDPEWLKRNGLELRDAYKLMRLTDDKKLQTLYIGRETYDIPNWYNADSPDLSMFDNLEQDYFYLFDDNNNVIDKKPIKYGKNYNIGGLTKKEILDANDNGFRWMTVARYADGSRKIGNMGINGGKDESPSWYAIRPGIHAGSEPSMQQIASGSKEEKAAMGGYRDDNLVWVKGKVLVGLNEEEMAELNAKGEIQSHIPSGGYIKGTSSFVTKGMDWFITNAFKPEKIISDREAMAEIDRANADPELTEKIPYDHPRRNGRLFNAETMELEEAAEKSADVTRMVEKEGVSEQNANKLEENGLVAEDGIVMSKEAQKLKEETGYKPLPPEGPKPKIRLSYGSKDEWKKNYLGDTPKKREEVIANVIDTWYNSAAADDLVHDYMNYRQYPAKGLNTDGKGPLRKNQEYRFTFDLDTTCPRTFQYLNYASEIEKYLGRPLSQREAELLIEKMRASGQMIPCTYCYAENKRQALKQYFLDFMDARKGVIGNKSEEDAFAAMYGHTKDGLTEAAQKVYERWRGQDDELNKYNPTIDKLVHDHNMARSVVMGLLDTYGESAASNSTVSLVERLCKELGVDYSNEASHIDKGIRAQFKDIVNEWRYDMFEGHGHKDVTKLDEDDLSFGIIDKYSMALWDEMTKYGKSASSAKNAVRYHPYTDELQRLSEEDKAFVNGMGGLRMHSTNDFRIDYVGDYFQLMADMSKHGFMGHTYTKSPEFVEIFGNTGYRINMSIAAYDVVDKDGNIHVVMNPDEGFHWETAKSLRSKSKNAGAMFMTTSEAQLQYALDSDWVDMIIPFHSSGLPKEIWYDMRRWEDAQKNQNESYLNSEEMRERLVQKGVEIPEGADVEKLYFKTFNIKPKKYDSKGKLITPHFLPGGGNGWPAHGNDAKKYFDLCEQYGVRPRFYGTKVKDANGNQIDVTEHPGYFKLIKETARTDYKQTPVQFNLDKPDPNLAIPEYTLINKDNLASMDKAMVDKLIKMQGAFIDPKTGMLYIPNKDAGTNKTPLDYAMYKLREFAGRNGYEGYKEDQFRVVDRFIEDVVNYEKRTGKQRPVDYLSELDRMNWAIIRGSVLDIYGEKVDMTNIPYHPQLESAESTVLKRREGESYKDYAQRVLDEYDKARAKVEMPVKNTFRPLKLRDGESWMQFAERVLEEWERSKKENQNPDDDPTTPNGGGKGRMRLSYGNSKERDKEYADAVKSGDEETARRMVKDAAKAAMPDTKVVDENGDPLVVYHGTSDAGFTEFWGDITYFTDDKYATQDYIDGNYDGSENPNKGKLPKDATFRNFGTIEEWNKVDDMDMSKEKERLMDEYISKANAYLSKFSGDRLERDGFTTWLIRNDGKRFYNPGLSKAMQHVGITTQGAKYPVYLEMNNPFVIDAKGESWDNLPITVNGVSLPEIFVYGNSKTTSTDTWAEFLKYEGKELGFDGLIVKNVFDSKTSEGTITDYITFEPNQIKSADPVTYDNDGNVIPLSERFNKNKKDIRFSFKGVLGTKRLDEVEKTTVRMDNHLLAKEMEKDRKKPSVIKLATGWERGADGQWRYEDSDGNFKPWWDGKTTTTLGEMWEDKALFDSYPEFKAIKVMVRNDKGSNGSYSSNDNIITIKGGRTPKEMRSTMVHEIQHAIQHIEGFSTGTNVNSQEARDYAASKTMGDKDIEEYKQTYFNLQKGLEEATAFINDYLDNKVIIEGQTEKKPEYLALSKDAKDYVDYYLSGNYFDHSYSWDSFAKKENRGLQEMIDEADAVYREEYYHNKGGEVESRNVQNRLYMSPEERRNSLASNTEDVPRDNQIRFSLGSAPRSAEMDAREADLDFKAEEKFNDVKTAYTDMMARQAGRLDTPEGIKDAARDITEFIQANINSFVADELGSMRIKSLITQIRRATTRQELEAPVKKAEQILNDAEIIATQKRLDKTMDAVLQKKNDRGVLVENRVHNTMREVFEGVRKTYDNPSLTSTASDMLIKKTSKEASALRGRIAALKAGTPKPEDAGHVGDAAWMANLDAKLKAKESEVRQNVQDRVDALNKAIEKELNDIDALRTKTDDDIADKISHGEAPGEDLVFQKVVTIPLKEAAVEVRNAYTDMESIKAQWQEELAILNGIRRAPGYKARKTAQAAKVAALEEAYMQAQEKVIKAAGMFNENMKYILSMGHEMLKDKMKAEVEHKKMIINSALGDVKHSKVRLEGERTGVARGIRNGLQKLDDYATIPLWSADFALQMADQNHRNGEGFLYKYYMKDPDHGLVAANDNMYKGRKAFGDALNNKVTEIFGIKESLLTGRSSFAELRQRAQEDLGVPIERTLTTDEAKKLTHNTGGRVIDQTEADLLNAIGYGDRDDWQAGDMRPWEKGDPYTVEHMTKAHALYLWLTWRQADGKMKMANMGYTDEAIDAIEKALGPEYIKLGEWMTEEFLPQLWQEKYLPRYKELYGTTIPITKKYFPLKIDKDSIRQTGGIDQMSKQFMVSTVTPALIQRTRNTAKIDPDADAFDVIQQYGNLMEQWHAMAPIIKDINTLHQSFAVKECMNANHEGSFNTLMKAFQVATGSLYDTDQSKNMRMLNEAIGKTISTGARAAIGFRVNTALKQMLSYPAFYAYRGDAQFYAELTANNPLLGIGLATAMFRGNKRTIGWRGTHEWALEHLPAYRQRVGEGDMGLEGMNDETWSDDAFFRQLSKLGMKANRFVDTMTIAAGARAVYNCAMRKAKKMGMSSEEAERFAVIEAEIAYNQSQQSSRPEFSSEAQKNGGSLVRSLLMFRNAAIGYTRQVRLSAHDMSKALRMCQQNGASETAKIMGAAAWTMATFGAMLPMYWYMGGHTNQMYQLLSGNGMDDDDEKCLWTSLATGMLTDGTTFGAPIAAFSSGWEYNVLPVLDDFYDTYINDRKTLTAQTAMQYALQYGIGLNLETMDNIMQGLDEIYKSATDAPDANLLIGVLLLINNPKSDRRGWARQMYAQYGPVEYAKAWNMASQVQQSEKRANDRVEETIERRDEDFYKAMQQIKDLEKTFNKATKEEQKAILESDEYKALQPIFDKGIWDTYSALIVPAMRANARKLNAEGVNFKKGGHGTLMQGASDETLMKELDKLIKQWKDLQNK